MTQEPKGKSDENDHHDRSALPQPLRPGARRSDDDFNVDGLKDCFKGSGSTKCDLGKFSKDFDEMSKGKKPTMALPIDPKSLPIGDFAKFQGK